MCALGHLLLRYYVAPRYLWKCFVFVLDNALRTQDIGKAFGMAYAL